MSNKEPEATKTIDLRLATGRTETQIDDSTDMGNKIAIASDTEAVKVITPTTKKKILFDGESISTDQLQLDLDPTIVAHSEGLLHWDKVAKTLAIDTEVTDVSLQVGQETVLRATNKSGSTIINGTAVYVDSAQGQRPTIEPAIASNLTALKTVGFTTQDIINNETGYVTIYGLVRDVDTSAFTDGDIIYLSETVAGGVQTTEPVAPNTTVWVGIVLYSHGVSGTILTKPVVVPRLSHLSDVDDRGTAADGEVLAWDNASGKWVPTDSKFDKVADDSDDLIEGSINLLMTVAERSNLANQSNTNTGDQDLSGLCPQSN